MYFMFGHVRFFSDFHVGDSSHLAEDCVIYYLLSGSWLWMYHVLTQLPTLFAKYNVLKPNPTLPSLYYNFKSYLFGRLLKEIHSHFCLECGTLLKNIITLFKIMPFYMLINSRPILSCKITAQWHTIPCNWQTLSRQAWQPSVYIL